MQGRALKIVKVVALLAAIVAVVVAVRWFRDHGRGVEIRIHNTDSRPLRSVVVIVTGNSYPLGDLPPDSTRSVLATPTSESSVKLSLIDADGEERQLSVPSSYFEPGNTGWILVEVTSTGARMLESHVELL